jgi:DNA (cytosine-5)-methyltransferase 1
MKKFAEDKSYPMVDLFAGPGGLSEGFSSLKNNHKTIFKSSISIEHENYAHQTLKLRHFYRLLIAENNSEDYYRYIAGKINHDELIAKHNKQWNEASLSALKISLGNDTNTLVKNTISNKLNGSKKWVLLGGPPCQAYSLIGRSVRSKDKDFEKDERHFLYKEYLKTIINHSPPVFVMENVKGLISAKIDGELVLSRILKDLRNPTSALKGDKNNLSYSLYSLSQQSLFGIDADPSFFLVKAEEYGIPQKRHRMFILGIRSDLNIIPKDLEKEFGPSVEDVIGGLPRIRSGLSKGKDQFGRWQTLIKESIRSSWFEEQVASNDNFASVAKEKLNGNAIYPKERSSDLYIKPKKMQSWFVDEKLSVLTGHQSRSHIEDDIKRYLFCSTYSLANKISPKLVDFPEEILPHHKSTEKALNGKMFGDRFRVQLQKEPSKTIVSHIGKDGHYFIHYDPTQSRSLTVREAARLQTFPDNYYFEGGRTSQYQQIGNAVPPYLASKIALVIQDILDRMEDN